ncbi:MAG TPA: Sec-independent protein translocase subunit TatA [Mycobacteriales bacterium]|nr:Sec-independent protein translocase subunit TatA [Mycobacteriales bacterium]
MFARLEPWHIIVLVIVFIALFGYKKLPDAARSVGRSMRILKAETKGLRGDDSDSDDTAAKPSPNAAESTAKQPSTDQA